MKLRVTFVKEYDLPESDLEDIRGADEASDPTDEFIEEAETEFFHNDPISFLEQRLIGVPDAIRTGVDGYLAVDIAEEMEHYVQVKVEVIEHGSSAGKD